MRQAALARRRQMLMGGRSLEVSPDDYIFAATQIYLDIINIFLNILQAPEPYITLYPIFASSPLAALQAFAVVQPGRAEQCSPALPSSAVSRGAQKLRSKYR